jgi:DNA-binding NarL/FixJ family response regulator
MFTASPLREMADAVVLDRDRLFGEVVRPLLEDLEFQVSVATIAEAAQELISRKRPRLTLVSLTLPADNGFAVGQHALATQSDAIVIGITSMADPHTVRESKRAGVWGCLSKDVPVSRFTSHVRAAMRGAPALSSRQCLEPARPPRRSRPLDLLAAQLTSRELQVLALLAEGAGSSQIAHELDISWNTVRTHAQSILTKLQVHSRLEAAAVAVHLGLVPDPTLPASGVA